jgi:hypothetical protein
VAVVVDHHFLCGIEVRASRFGCCYLGGFLEDALHTGIRLEFYALLDAEIFCVRELENLIERGVILSTGRTLEIDATALNQVETAKPATLAGIATIGKTGDEPHGSGTLKDLERTHIVATLESCGWKVKGRGNAAERLGLNEATLRSRMRKLGVKRPGHPGSGRSRC